MARRLGFFARATAICLLLLAISPLTAPFSTLDLATPAGQAGACDSSSLKTKTSTAATWLPTPDGTGTTMVAGVAGRSPAPADRRQARPLVLRV